MSNDNDLIRRMDAVKICEKHSYSNNQYVSMRMIDAASEIRDLPAASVTVPPAPAPSNFTLSENLQRAVENVVKAPKWDTTKDQLVQPPPDVTQIRAERDMLRNALQAIADLNSISAIEFARKYPELDKALGKDIEMWGEVLSDFASDVLKETV